MHDEFGLLPHVRRTLRLARRGRVRRARRRPVRGPRRADLRATRSGWPAGWTRCGPGACVAVAATQLLARPKVRPQRVGAVGFGLGGRLALLTATTGALDAIVAFYAVLGPDERSLVPCPTLLHLTGGPTEQEQATVAFLRELRASGTDVTARTWSGVAPGFANADRPGYLEKSAVAAWVESAGFLAGHLRR